MFIDWFYALYKIGEMSETFLSTKVIELGSCAFRQWKSAPIRCSKIHGYQLTAKFWFGCKSLDDKNWAVDFGGFNILRDALKKQFDHTTCVASDDPHLAEFKRLHDLGVIDLRIMRAVGTEKTAQWVFETASEFISKIYGDRCWVEQVEVFEHGSNSAIYTNKTKEVVNEFPTPIQDEVETAVEKQEEAVSEPVYNNSRAAPVGRRSTPGIGDLYAGTIWG